MQKMKDLDGITPVRGWLPLRRNSVIVPSLDVGITAGHLDLGIATTTESSGTLVQSVNDSSVLAEKISPGDRIIAIDGEDVSLMNVSDLKFVRTIGSERKLTVRV
jgi:C-terminal processing protease CtpA/Prc